MFRFLIVLLLPIFIHASELKRWVESPPSWMWIQLKKDYAPYKDKKLSVKKIRKLYEKRAQEWCLVEFTIDDRRVSYRTKIPGDHFLHHRIVVYERLISDLAKELKLPDMTFLISMADGVDLPPGAFEGIPVFSMCKRLGDESILIPDFEALNGAYQVLRDNDVVQWEAPWETKIPKLIWRGSTAQGGLVTPDNCRQLSRVRLCLLSFAKPKLIDAKFTHLAQLSEPIPYLNQFLGDWVSFEEQFQYKYHIIIDGNASAYSSSGWKFFTHSLVFKPHSTWVQWYFQELKPWLHYIPIEADLSDLVENIHWAMENDSVSQTIAHSSREFALNHITLPQNVTYLYLALSKYSKLKFN